MKTGRIEELCADRPIWRPEGVFQEVSEGAIRRNLWDALRRELDAIPKEDLRGRVAVALRDPKPLDICHPVLNAVLAAQYYEVFGALNLPREVSVYEPCVGASAPVIMASETHSGGRANYFTINLNRKLREELQNKIGHLRMAIRIIQDNAQQALSHLKPDCFDVACFHHAVNDILETAVSEPRGMNTVTVDWFPNERQMIEWLAEDATSGRIETRGKPELLQIIRDAVSLVRPGGYLVFDHFNWEKYRGPGWFPWDLFYNLIPMTRRWVAEAGMPVAEVRIAGADPQWWMFLRVEKR